ncbi:unnamed protein product [Rhodiola kirilowii]
MCVDVCGHFEDLDFRLVVLLEFMLLLCHQKLPAHPL